MEFFSTEIIVSLITLTFLEIVLGIDNIVFISIVSGRLPALQQKKARIIVISLAFVGEAWRCPRDLYFIYPLSPVYLRLRSEG